MQLGPTIRIPAARIFSTRTASRRRPSSPVSENPAVIMMMALTPLAAHSSTAASASAAGIRDDGEVHVAGDVREPRVARDSQDLFRVGIDRHDLAFEAVRNEVVEDLGADLAALTAGAEDGHDFRLE